MITIIPQSSYTITLMKIIPILCKPLSNVNEYRPHLVQHKQYNLSVSRSDLPEWQPLHQPMCIVLSAVGHLVHK